MANKHTLEQLKNELEKTKSQLGERIKEFNCLHDMMVIVEKPGITLEKLLQDLVTVIPPAWQYPHNTCCRILFNEKKYLTEPFHQSERQQQAELIVRGEKAGQIEVFRFDECPDEEDHFLPEEQTLLDMIAERLGRIIERLQAEEKLTKREAELREAQRIAQLGRWELNHQTQVLDWSDTIFEIFEIDPEEFGASYEAFLNAVHPDDRETVDAAYTQSLKNRKPYNIEHRLLMNDGRIKWVHENCYTDYDTHGQPIRSVGIVQDITERKFAEDMIRREHEMLVRTEQIANVGSWEWNIASDTVTWSEELFRIFKRDPLEGAPSFAEHPKLYIAEDTARLQQAVEKCVRDGTPYELELRAIRTDGAIRHCIARGQAETNSEGNIHRLVGSLQDVTARKLAELALEASEEHYRTTLKAIGDGVIVTDTAGQVTVMNPIAEQLTGWPLSDAEGMPLESVFHIINAENRQRVHSPVERVLSTGKIIGLANHTMLISRTGDKYQIADSAAPIQNDAGDVIGVVLVFRDVTAEYESAEELRRSEERFRIFAELAPVGIVISDKEENTLYANPAFAEMFGYTIDEMPSVEAWWSLAYPDEAMRTSIREEWRRVMDEARINHSQIGPVEYPVACKDGTVRYIEFRVSCSEDLNVVVFNDITDRKGVETELRDALTELSVIHESAPISMLLVDRERRVRKVNGAAAKLAQRTDDEMIGLVGGEAMRCLGALDDPRGCGYGPRCSECQVRLAALETFEDHEARVGIEAWIPFNRDGGKRERCLEISTAYLEFNDEERVLVCMQDITDRKHAEESLARNKAELQAIYDNAQVMLCMLDEDRRVLYANPAFTSFTGVSEDELRVGRACGVFGCVNAHDDSRGCGYGSNCADCDILSALEDTLATGNEHKNIETHLSLDSGDECREVTLLASTNLIPTNTYKTLLLSLNDITEIKQAEETLSKQSEAMDASIEGMAILDADGKYIYLNTAHVKIYGYDTPEELLGKSWQILYEQKERDRFITEIMPTFQKNGVWSGEATGKKKDGSTFPQEVSLTALSDGGLICVVQDITERKLVETQLNIQSLVLNQIYDRVTVTDLDGIITYINDAEVESLGYTREELIGSSTHVYGEDGSRGATQREILETTLRDGQWRGEVVNQTADGRHVIMDCRTHIVFDEHGKKIALCGISTDITERKQTEEALRISEQQYRSLVDNANEAIVVAQDGMLRFVNNYLLELMEGYTEDELTSIPFSSFILPEDQDTVVTNHVRRINGEDLPHRYSFRIITHSGTVKWLEINAVLIEWDGKPASLNFLTDITDRKKADEELQRRESQLQQIFEILPIGLWFADKDGTLLRGNPAGVKIWGAEPHVPISEYGIFKAWRLPSGEPIEPDDWALAKTIRNGETIVDELLEIESFDGTKKTILNYTAPVLDNNGEIDGAIVINLDITERQELENQLRQSQKMEAVGRLAGGVAHDFNNMLSVITGNAELVLSTLDDTDPNHGEIKEIMNAAERSADLTRQLLAFARKQTVAPKILNLNAMIKSMLKMLGRLIGEDIDLLWKPGKKLDPVYMDPTQIDQLLANLVVNARDAIGHNVGKVTIETGNVDFDEEYCTHNTGFIPGCYVMLAVSDNGYGMDAETKARVFEPFFTTKGQGKGTGLGLATVYGIVKQNQGFVNVYSEPDQGTTLKIYLPVHTQQVAAETNNRRAKPIKPGHETILLVEDEPSILNLGRKILKRLGYQVIAASTPGEAIRLADEHTGRIDLLITDVVMPEMNGRDLAKNLLSLYPDIKRLFMSGYTANVIAHQGVLDEGVNFIQKPFSLQGLSEKVREVLDKE